ncbi:MAG TPA: hypothetical protein VHP37_29550 [Burkholderiales bacterium]|nr:hypothetical protein [Burkholderiales bacterium]
MESWGIARALHVVGVVLWIGGVAMVTTVLLPAVAARGGTFDLFEALEHRFARQARWTTALVGLTGLYLVVSLDLWQRFPDPRYWWMSAMVIVWAIFTAMLFVIEPLFLHRRLAARAQRDSARTLRLVARMHWVLLALSLLTVVGAVAGSHGVLLFS